MIVVCLSCLPPCRYFPPFPNLPFSVLSVLVTLAETIMEEAPSTDLETGLIAGIVIGVVVMLSVVIIVVLVRKRKSRYMPVPPKDPEDTLNGNSVKLNNVCRSKWNIITSSCHCSHNVVHIPVLLWDPADTLNVKSIKVNNVCWYTCKYGIIMSS